MTRLPSTTSALYALPLFRLLRHGRVLRGTALDPFGYQAERRWEHALLRQYADDMQLVAKRLSLDNLHIAVALAELPGAIRGFGPVKNANRETAMAWRDRLLTELDGAPPAHLGQGSPC